jgi:chorismate synthase
MVEFRTGLLPAGLGEPVYEKISSCLASALMSIPGAKGIEIGSGFASVAMKGSEHNDLFLMDQNRVCTQTNHAGGLLGGITNGMPLVGRVAFKPPSSIAKPMNTLTTKGDRAVFELPVGSRHDPCIAIRSVPVVEAIVALVLADALLMDRTSRI